MAGLPWSIRKKFYEQASARIENGLGLMKVLGDFKQNLERSGKKKFAGKFHRIYGQVENGETLTVSMWPDLPDLERSVLDVGEKIGKLPRSMKLILEVREIVSRIVNQCYSSFFAPVVYLLSFYATLYVIGVNIVPQLAEALPVSKWTGWAAVMYDMGEFSTTWRGPLITLIAVAYAAWAIWALPRWKGPGRTFVDRYVFPFSTYRDVTGFTWLLSYAALLKAGVPDLTALQNQIASSSPWLASRLRPIEAGLINGFDLAASMRIAGHGFPSFELIDELGAYVGFPNFSEMIEVVAKQHAAKLERTLISRSVILGLLFSGLMFMAMLVLQLGANSISTLITINAGH